MITDWWQIPLMMAKWTVDVLSLLDLYWRYGKTWVNTIDDSTVVVKTYILLAIQMFAKDLALSDKMRDDGKWERL